jgi:hypothetical protein
MGFCLAPDLPSKAPSEGAVVSSSVYALINYTFKGVFPKIST